jgi:hypothetical protein
MPQTGRPLWPAVFMYTVTIMSSYFCILSQFNQEVNSAFYNKTVLWEIFPKRSFTPSLNTWYKRILQIWTVSVLEAFIQTVTIHFIVIVVLVNFAWRICMILVSISTQDKVSSKVYSVLLTFLSWRLRFTVIWKQRKTIRFMQVADRKNITIRS